ncbi:MAG: hypothetical protein MRZ54_03405 [Clostridiales bacterium]|nr:hypothetical protein [Clostridiales bacterium]
MEALQTVLTAYRAFLKQEIDTCCAHIARLEAAQRQDEANIEKVRRNIIGVFETLLAADEAYVKKTNQPTLAAFCDRFCPRFESLPISWRARLEAARAHADPQAQLIEETKLATANSLWQAFQKTKEAAQ